MKRLLLLGLCLGSLAGGIVRAEDPSPTPTPPPPPPPPKLRSKAEAHAPEESIIKPISVDVTVVNDAKQSCLDLEIDLELIPEGHHGIRTYTPGGSPTSSRGESALDPVTLEHRIDELYPGRSRKITFDTPYYASNGFHNDFGYFLVENLVPNMRHSVMIYYKVHLKVQGEPVR